MRTNAESAMQRVVSKWIVAEARCFSEIVLRACGIACLVVTLAMSAFADDDCSSPCSKETAIENEEVEPKDVKDGDGLKLSIAIPHREWREGDQLQIAAVLVNNGDEAIQINTGQPLTGFQGTFVDGKGKEFGMLITPLKGSHRRAIEEHWKRLEPGASLELTLKPLNIYDWDKPQSHTWTELFPGEFRLKVSYVNHESTYWDEDQEKTVEVSNAWVGKKKIESNEVTFKVE